MKDELRSKIDEVVTIPNAKQYMQAKDKFRFCAELLGIGDWTYGVFEPVETLQAKFDDIVGMVGSLIK